jgi:hypothetical protein
MGLNNSSGDNEAGSAATQRPDSAHTLTSVVLWGVARWTSAIVLWVAALLGVMAMIVILFALLVDVEQKTGLVVGMPVAVCLVSAAAAGTALEFLRHEDRTPLELFLAEAIAVLSASVLYVFLGDLAGAVLWGLALFWVAVMCVHFFAGGVLVSITHSRVHDPIDETEREKAGAMETNETRVMLDSSEGDTCEEGSSDGSSSTEN